MRIYFICISIWLILSPLKGQYSGYYHVSGKHDHDVNVKANVTINKNVSGTVNHTITTIDYGALAQANALREANLIESEKLQINQQNYRDQKERERALLELNHRLEVAKDPLKALEYGYTQSYILSNKVYGLVEYTINLKHPHTSLFKVITSPGKYSWQNISDQGIRTEIIMSYDFPQGNGLNKIEFWEEEKRVVLERYSFLWNLYKNSEMPLRKNYKTSEEFKLAKEKYIVLCDSLDSAPQIIAKAKLWAEAPGTVVGQKQPNGGGGDSVFIHKKELVKRKVASMDGYCGTAIWEDDLEYGITDHYYANDNNGTLFFWKVRYTCDKIGDLDFEDLEGRRFYLRRMVDEFIATMRYENITLMQRDKKYPKMRNFRNPKEYSAAKYNWKKKKYFNN